MLNKRNVSEREKMLNRVRELAFAAHEINLFLDSHPDNKMALRYFRKYNEEMKKATALFEENYGPITVSAASNCEEWTWINRPWPWENTCEWEDK